MRPKSPPGDRIITEIGEELFQFLFQGELKYTYETVREKAQEQGKNIRFRLCFESPRLTYLPWETLYDGNQHVSLDPKSALARHARFDDGRNTSQPAPLPIAILGMVPSIRRMGEIELAQINVEDEQDNIRRAVQDLEKEGKVILRWASGWSQDVALKLRRPPEGCATWHVFHFAGHGALRDSADDPGAQPGGFLLADPNPQIKGAWTSIDAAKLHRTEVLQMLQWSPQTLRLVFLNACKSAAGGPGSASIAEYLVRNGHPAVIAMQYEISDWAAIYFSYVLYTWLANGHALPDAVIAGRQALQEAHSTEWVTPVLYMRDLYGNLFRS
jgi:CHAT domain-containing protein